MGWEATLLKSQMKNKHLKACETFDLKNDKTEEVKKTLTYCSNPNLQNLLMCITVG